MGSIHLTPFAFPVMRSAFRVQRYSVQRSAFRVKLSACLIFLNNLSGDHLIPVMHLQNIHTRL